MLFRITPFSQPPGLDDWLAQRGYQRFDDTRVMVCPTLPRQPAEPMAEGTRFEVVDSEAYAHIIGEFRGTALSGRQAHAERLKHSPVPYQGMRAARGRWRGAGLRAVRHRVRPGRPVRRVHGTGRSAAEACRAGSVRALLAQAREQGARTAYLQVDADNHAARAVYLRLGFADGYAYHYRALPSADG